MPSRRVGSARGFLLQTKRAIQAEVVEATREFGDLAVAEHEAVVEDWEHKPQFRKLISISFGSIGVQVVAHGRYATLWLFVDQGTRPHIITPKKPGGYLTFRLGYDPKTAPIGKFDVGTGEASGDWVSTKIVNHPGTKARKFTEDIAEKLTPIFRRLIENAFRRAIRRTR